MTKADVIDSVQQKLACSKAEASETVEFVFSTIKSVLEEGQTVKVHGFGTFVVREKKAREGRNPQTGMKLEIASRRVVAFRPSQILKNRVNGLDEGGEPLATGVPPASGP